MILKKIVLTNIKSYEYEEIDFSQGINCILGLNGSGKSTIIESIGIGLFNYCKTKAIGDVLRYNETKGAIEIEFVAEDQVTYKVIRNIKPKSSTVKIIDVNSDVELYSGVSDVYSFIKSVLKVSNNKEFSKMFEEIVAVPQGQYVSAFLAKSSERKDNFDKLFELHVYKDISQKLKNLTDNVNNNKIAKLKEELANINGRLVNYNVQVEEANNLKSDINKNNLELDICNNKLTNSYTKKEEQEQYKIKLDNASHKKLMLNEKAKNLEQNILELNKNVDKSELAYKVITDTKSDYQKYQENQKIMTKCEADVEQLNKFISMKNQAEIESVKQEETIKNLIAQIEEKKKELVIKKDEFAKQNQEELLNKTLTSKSMEKYLENDTKYNQKITELQEKKEQNFKKKSLLDLYKKRYENECKFDIKMLVENQKKILEIDAKNELIFNAKNELKSISKKQAMLEEKSKNLIANSQMVVDGKCPIFHTKCMNINEVSLNEYFNNEIEKVNNEINILRIEEEKLEAVVNEESDLLVIKQKLENDNYFIQVQEETLKKLSDEIVRDFSYKSDLSNNSISNILFEIEEKLDKEKDQNEKDEEELSEKKKLLIIELEQINSNKVRDETKKVYLDNLDKEIKQTNSFILLNSQSLELMDNELNEKKKEVLNLNDRINHLAESKILLEKIKNEQKQLEDNKNKYIANLDKANELNTLQTDYLNKTTEFTQIKNDICNIEVEIKQLEEQFSIKLLEALTIEVNNYSQTKTKLETLNTEFTKRYEDLCNKIKELDELKIVKEEKKKELIKYQNITDFLVAARAIYKDLPAKLSKTYREYLSKASTILYRQISSENVRLDIADDYRVDIIDDLKPTNTKYMEELSGGEQMSVALAIRLAMLKHIAGINIYFLDEPTINLDYERREKVAEVVKDVSSELSQLFVISHDDTFENITTNTVKIEKIKNVSNRVI